MAAGRPKGSKNKFPNHSKVRDELLAHNFDWVEQFAKLFHESPSDVKCNMLLGIAKYLFPVRKPEDGKGDASPDFIIAPVPYTLEERLQMIEGAKGQA